MSLIHPALFAGTLAILLSAPAIDGTQTADDGRVAPQAGPTPEGLDARPISHSLQGDETRFVGGVWYLDHLTEDLTVDLSVTLPEGDGWTKFLFLFQHPASTTPELQLSYIVGRAGDLGYQYRTASDEGGRTFYTFAEEIGPIHWAEAFEKEAVNGTIFTLIMYSSTPTRLGLELLDLPPTVRKIDAGETVIGNEAIGEGSGLYGAAATVSSWEGEAHTQTQACAYGALGLFVSGFVSYSNESFDVPDDRVQEDSLSGPRYLVLGTQPADWHLRFHWTGEGDVSPYVLLMEGDCPADLLA